MTRPTPRKSTLGQSHPAAPQAPSPTVTVEPAAATATPVKARSPRTKMTFYTTAEQAGQVRAVLANVPSVQHGYRNVSEFLDAAVAEKVHAMQERYNGGKPWPPAHPGTVSRGRPVE